MTYRVTRRILAWIAMVALVLSASASVGLSDTGAASSPGCATSGPSGGSYTVTVCFTSPADGDTLTGSETVSASVTTSGTSPGVSKLLFYLSGEYVLTDYEAPYTFVMPTSKWVDGSKTLSVQAVMRDGYISDSAQVATTFSNGVTTVGKNPNHFAPTSGTAPADGHPFVLAAVGDGAGGESPASSVVNLISSWNPNLFLYLGDVYNDGRTAEFYNWYGTGGSNFSRFRAITDPTVGNHEYQGSDAPGYFDYWDNVPHYYSFDANGWHFISLDSTSQFGETDPGSDQYQWLQQDLASDTDPCTIAFFHHPLYNVGAEGPSTRLSAIWSLLAQRGVDIVLNGHDHDYQRWQPLDGSGRPASDGITEFVVGTGGHGVQSFITTDNRLVVGYDTSPYAFGALKMTLNTDGAGYQFINTDGSVLDSGSIHCSGAPPDTAAPSAPTNLAVTSNTSSHVDLSWSPSNDNVGVEGYDIYRSDNPSAPLASVGSATTYRDDSVAGATTYQYYVIARDAAGNRSAPSNTVTTTTQAVTFQDGFESGSFGLWTKTYGGMSVQSSNVLSGDYAARATTTGDATWAYKTLATARSDLYFRVWFNMLNQGGNNVYIQRFRTSDGSSILGAYVSSAGKLAYRDDIAGVSRTSSTLVTPGWHQLQVHLTINTTNGSAGQTEVWLDGTKVDSLSRSENLGTARVGRLQIGDNSTGRTYDLAFDDVAADTQYIDTSDTEAPEPPTGLTGSAVSPTEIDLRWSPATDNVGVTGYDVYRGNSLLASLGAETTYRDTSGTPGTTYTYTVRARDAAGNVSAASAGLTVSTPPDTTAPTVSVTAPADGSTAHGTVTLSADASDDIGVEEVDFLVNGVVVGTAYEGPPYTIYWDSSTVPDGSVTLTARAEDSSGNQTVSAPATITVRNAAPDTTIDSGPNGTVASSSATFSFSSDDSAATFSCQIDGGSWSDCASPVSYSNLPDGSHTFEVRASDSLGNTDPTPATRQWTVDTTGPTVTSTSPGDGASSVALDTQLRAVFSEPLDPSTITSDTFVLVPQGSSTAVPASVTYDSDTRTATLAPASPLDQVRSYVATVKGGPQGVADLVGNHAGADTSWSFTTADVTPPSAPTSLTATAVSGSEIDLQWSPATDNVGVAGYQVFRDSVQVGATSGATSYQDNKVTAGTSYTYTVKAVDAAGNVSDASSPASATARALMFADGFESGDMSAWASNSGMTVQSATTHAGAFAAEANSPTGTARYASVTLSSTQSDLYGRIYFKLSAQPATTLTLMRFRTASNASILGPYLTSTGRLGYRDDVASVSRTSSTVVSPGVWHELEVHVVINGTAGQTEVWLDGVKVDALSQTENLGTTPVGRVQIGDNASRSTPYDLFFDDVGVDTAPINP